MNIRISRLCVACILTLATLLIASLGCGNVVQKAAQEMAPRVTAVNVNLADVTLADATVEVKTTMDNANAVAAVLSDLSFECFYWSGSQWDSLAQGGLGSTQISPTGSLEITIPTTVKTKETIAAMARLLANQGSLRLKLAGSAKAKVGSASFVVPFGQQFALSLGTGIKMPSPPALPPR